MSNTPDIAPEDQPDILSRREVLKTAAAGLVLLLPLASASPDLLVADQTTGTGACTGDSGGPALTPGADLLVVGVLIGVSSARSTNDYCRGKAWFASLARWRPWLETTAISLGQPLP